MITMVPFGLFDEQKYIEKRFKNVYFVKVDVTDFELQNRLNNRIISRPDYEYMHRYWALEANKISKSAVPSGAESGPTSAKCKAIGICSRSDTCKSPMQAVRDNKEYGPIYNLSHFLKLMEKTVMQKDLCKVDNSFPNCLVLQNHDSEEKEKGNLALMLLQNWLKGKIGKEEDNKEEISKIRRTPMFQKLSKRFAEIEELQKKAKEAKEA